MTLAPIGLSTYKRLGHLQQTVAALQSNDLARQSSLFIFSDGAVPGDEDRVQQVREYLATVGGFRSVEIVQREVNYGLDRNSMDGIQQILGAHDRLIWLEEDCVTSPSFIRFLNQALEVYRDNRHIFSVTGYCPPIQIPEDYQHDVYVLPRHCAWGSAMWKDRLDLVPRVLPQEDLGRFFHSPDEQLAFGEGGVDLFNMLRKEARSPHAPDVRMFFRQYQLGMDTIYPVGALTRNIGLDGTGAHSRKSTHKDVVLTTGPQIWDMPAEISRDERIIRAHFLWRLGGRRWYRRPGHVARLVSYLIGRLWRGKALLPGAPSDGPARAPARPAPR